MKKLILVLAAALALSLLCSCAKPLPEEPVQADPEPEAPAEVHVTTFTADILSSGGGTLTKTRRSVLRTRSRSRWPTGLSPLARTAGPFLCPS